MTLSDSVAELWDVNPAVASVVAHEVEHDRGVDSAPLSRRYAGLATSHSGTSAPHTVPHISKRST